MCSQSGTFDWQDSCRLCLENANHPSFFVAKLWSYFLPTAPRLEGSVGSVLTVLHDADHPSMVVLPETPAAG